MIWRADGNFLSKFAFSLLLSTGAFCLPGKVTGTQAPGSIVGWGSEVALAPDQLQNIVAVSGGRNHSLALTSYGSILAWGDNQYGQCNVPQPNSDFIAVAAGVNFSLGLKANGSVVGWGDNYDGQCNAPAPNSNFIKISAGASHSLGLKSDGTIVAWGNNVFGQCNVPPPDPNFMAISAAGGHSLALKGPDGIIVAWGRNSDGECNVPLPNLGFTRIAGGASFSVGLKSNGSVVAWGVGAGTGTYPWTGFVEIAAGGSYGGSQVLGLKSDGSVFPLSGHSEAPVPNANFIAVTCGDGHELGLKSDGSVAAWGENTYGQCNAPGPNDD